jgi:DNA mismatch endonuclease (patch repair protein)
VIISKKTVIECDGCYWHGCPVCNLKKYNGIEERKRIDKKRTKELEKKGFRVIRIWEHEIRAMELNDFKGIIN